MAQEIELKFIVDNGGIDTLRNHLNTLPAQHTPASQLRNTYYETDDAWLRRHDIGLRIRGDNGRYEMTMKLAGRVMGGLHQRPEYNITLNQPTLELDKFPADVWPQGELPADLAQRVQPLFSTDFYRERWQVSEGDSRIEIALDLGDINAGEYQEPICELELELLSGNAEDVLTLARQLIDTGVLRQGSLSKAARGYHLAQGNAERAIKPAQILRVAAKANIELALETALEQALAHWLYHEELWVRGDEKAQEEIIAAIDLIRHTLMLVGGIVPRKATAHLRDWLTQAQATLACADSTPAVVFSAPLAMAKLVLTQWLLTRGWRPFLDDKAQAKIADSFKRFADMHLSRHAAELKQTFAHPLGDAYVDQLPRLARDIDSVQILAGYYDENVVQRWLANWQGLHHAIATRQHIEIEHFRNEALAVEPFWLHSGKR